MSARRRPKVSSDDVANPFGFMQKAPEFYRQVQAERKKVVWPTPRETVMTAVMVVIMTALLGLFFFVVDTGFEAVIKLLLALAK